MDNLFNIPLNAIKTVDNLLQNFKEETIDEQTIFRTGDYGLVCQNDNGTYNPDMEDFVYSPTIDIPAGDQVSVDFLVKGSLLDPDDFPNVDYWGMQISPDGGDSWYSLEQTNENSPKKGKIFFLMNILIIGFGTVGKHYFNILKNSNYVLT